MGQASRRVGACAISHADSGSRPPPCPGSDSGSVAVDAAATLQ